MPGLPRSACTSLGAKILPGRAYDHGQPGVACRLIWRGHVGVEKHRDQQGPIVDFRQLRDGSERPHGRLATRHAGNRTQKTYGGGDGTDSKCTLGVITHGRACSARATCGYWGDVEGGRDTRWIGGRGYEHDWS